MWREDTADLAQDELPFVVRDAKGQVGHADKVKSVVRERKLVVETEYMRHKMQQFEGKEATYKSPRTSLTFSTVSNTGRVVSTISRPTNSVVLHTFAACNIQCP
jgi:hypothetical protein